LAKKIRRLKANTVKEEKEEYTASGGFQKLWIWQKSFNLMKEIHDICKKLPVEEKYKIKDQIERSSASVCDNIAEGHGTYYYSDKMKSLRVARKEAGETQNHILKMSVKSYLDEKDAKNMVDQYEEVIRGINGYINYLRSKKMHVKRQ
jgi:four helix bundle protein